MHREMYRAYERLFSRLDFSGPVLEVGATPDSDSLLCLPAFRNFERVGLNLDGPHRYDGFEIVKGDAARMPRGWSSRFGLVACNAVLEHVKRPLDILDEIRRVTKPGGWIVIGVPGYKSYPAFERWQGRIGKLFPFIARHRTLNAVARMTPVFQVHNEPGDFYRYSDQWMREVAMEGLTNVEAFSVMLPPRLIGAGIKPLD